MHSAKILSLVFGLALVTAACGDSKSSLNPTAPSAVSADSLQVESDGGAESAATKKGPKPGNGNGNGGGGNGNGNGNNPRTPTNTNPLDPSAPLPPGKNKVEFEGLIQALGGGSITVNGQTITVTEDTVIRHGNRTFELSALNVGDRVHVRAQRVAAPASGASTLPVETTLEATLILLQNPGDESDPGEGEDDGLVSVMPIDASAIEGADNPGVFRLTRVGTASQLASPLTVTFTLAGTAVNGSDYTLLPLTATFDATETTVDVEVSPLVDNLVEGPENVVLTLTSVAPFELGSPITAMVVITDAVNPLVSVLAADPSANESGDTGRFVLSRTGDLGSPLTVTVAFSGTAVNGTDYETMATTVVFAAGAATSNQFVIPMADTITDVSETVILTVVDGESYDLGAAVMATVTITGS